MTAAITLIVLASIAATGCSEAPDRPASRVTPKVVTGDIPCGPDKVLKHVCQFCHTNPPQHDAPFPLVTYANTQAEMDGKPIWFWMEKYVSEEIMPLPPVEITDDDRTTLLAWLHAGAPARPIGQMCDGDGGVLVPDTGLPDEGMHDDAAPDACDAADAGDTTNADDANGDATDPEAQATDGGTADDRDALDE